MRIPRFFTEELSDHYDQQNFMMLIDFLKAETPLQGFKLLTATLTTTGEQLIPHTLGFLPQDLIVTQATGSATLQWNYSKFTAQALSVTVGGSCTPDAPATLRMLAGTLNKGAV